MTYVLSNYWTHIRYDHPVVANQTIAAGGSNGIEDLFLELEGHSVLPVGIRLPFQWTPCLCYFSGLAAPQQAFYTLYLEHELYNISAFIADVYIAINPLVFLGLQRVRINCGTPDAPVDQVAQRTVQWHLRRTSP
jgi:hypothetical protein